MKNPITSYPTTPYNINCSSWTPEFTLGFLWGSCLSLSLDFCVILVFCLTFWSFSCGHCIIFTHIYCFWLPLRYLLSFFMWSLYYFYSHLLLLIITPSVSSIIVLTCGQRLRYRIISLRGEAHKTSFIEVSVPIPGSALGLFIFPSRDGLYYVIGYGGRTCVHIGFRTITLVL